MINPGKSWVAREKRPPLQKVARMDPAPCFSGRVPMK
jgi:hypothetical protein